MNSRCKYLTRDIVWRWRTLENPFLEDAVPGSDMEKLRELVEDRGNAIEAVKVEQKFEQSDLNERKWAASSNLGSSCYHHWAIVIKSHSKFVDAGHH